MSQRRRSLLYPARLIGSLPTWKGSSEFKKVHDWRTVTPVARRVPLLFDVPIQLEIRVSSRIGLRKNWIIAGYIAQVIRTDGGAIASKKQISRVYLDAKFIDFMDDRLSYYLEFWPHYWLSDYRIEVWARRSPKPVMEQTEWT